MQQNMYFVATVQNQQLTINGFLGKWAKKSAGKFWARGGQKKRRGGFSTGGWQSWRGGQIVKPRNS